MFKNHTFRQAIRVLAVTLLLMVATMVGSVALASGSAPKSSSTKLKLSPSAKTVSIGSGNSDKSFSVQPNVTEDAAPKMVATWKSSNTKVAKVDQNGKVTPVGKGTATIQYSAMVSGKKQTATCRVTIKPIEPTGVTLSIPRTSLYVGKTATLGVSITPADAYNKSVTFKSSNKAVASVSAQGVVTAKKSGKATISVQTKSGKKVASVKVSVTPDLSGGKFRLIAVGQANYMGDSKLPGCKKDVEMIASAFGNATYSGKKASVHPYYNLTGAQLRNLLKDMGDMSATSADTTIFYYSGHGMAGGGMNGALCGVDWDMVTVDEVQRYLDRVPGKVVVMLDSCLSGQYISSKSASGESEVVQLSGEAFNAAFIAAFQRNAAAKALTDSTYKSKYKIITAAAPKQASYISSERRDGCSVFSDYAAQGLGEDYANGKIALQADASRDGIVTLSELYTYINRRVSAYVQRYPTEKQTTMVWPKNDNTPIIARS